MGVLSRIYFGQWGTAPFQSLYERGPGHFQSLLMMPEWYLFNLALALIGLLGIAWRPLLLVLPVLALSVGLPMANACAAAARSQFNGFQLPLKVLTALLHMLQPAARLHGRLLHGLGIWRSRIPLDYFVVPIPRKIAVWTERWQPPQERLAGIEALLKEKGVPVQRGGACDNWDLEIQGGLWAGARMLMAVEDHGAGTQYVRCRVWPKCYPVGLALSLTLILLSAGAALAGAWEVFLPLGAGALLSTYKMLRESGGAFAAILQSIRVHGIQAAEQPS